MCNDQWSPDHPSPPLLTDHGPLKCRKHLLHSDDDDQDQVHHHQDGPCFLVLIKVNGFLNLLWLSHTFSSWVVFCFNTRRVPVSLRRVETRRELTPGNKVFIGHNNHESIKKKILNLSKTEVINMQPITGAISFVMLRILRIYLSSPWIESQTRQLGKS